MLPCYLKSSIEKELWEHAIKEYPSECCGWIIEYPSTGEQKYFPSENLQDKYHAIDPKNYPRTSREAFLLDARKLERSLEEAEKKGGYLFAIVHSHIDVDAYFSKEDEDKMTFPDTKEPIFPSKFYIVLSVVKKEPNGIKAYSFKDGVFQEVPIKIL